MILEQLLKKNRSYRRFDESVKISGEWLRSFVALTRYCPSGHNLQPLRFILVNRPTTCEVIRKNLKWAGGLKGAKVWKGPQPGERPTAYIVIIQDLGVRKTHTIDHGIAALAILLEATRRGLGGCMFTSVNGKQIIDHFSLQGSLKVVMVIALGKPAEQVILDNAVSPDDLMYWRDEESNHHVPKLNSQYCILGEFLLD